MASFSAFLSKVLGERLATTSEPKWKIKYVNGSVDQNLLNETASGICMMSGQRGTTALGFFASIQSVTKELNGVFTSNQVIGIDHLQASREIRCWIRGDAEVTISPNNYCFTCSLLGVSFIMVDPETKEEIERKGGTFLSVEEAQPTPETSVLTTALENGSTLTAVIGSVVENWGCGFSYSAVTEFDLTGSPVLAVTGKPVKVVGMHLCYCPINRCSMAVRMRYVIQAIRTDFAKATPPLRVYSLSQLNDQQIQLLKQNKLEQLTDCLFISPATANITPIWFMRTSHSWFWTPMDPTDGGNSNWMRISPEDDLAVVGGFWDGQEPALRNITIIRYLQCNGDQFLMD